MPQPNKIPKPFAASGDKNTIPESTETIGLASWNEGFPAITSTPFAEGGLAPKRNDFNGIFNALSAATVWNQQGGVYAYDNTTDYEVGNVVLYSGNLYKCLVANGPSSAVKAPSDTTVWDAIATASGYLPLSGGTMTGDISFNATFPIIKKISDDGSLGIYGGSASGKGAEIAVLGKDNTSKPGYFELRARDGTNNKILQGKPDGTLTWDGKAVETNISNTTAYYRLSNGLQILTGSASSSSSAPVTVNFSHPFAEAPRVMISSFSTSTTMFVPKCESIKTSFDLVCVNSNNSYISASVRWLAFGIGA